MASLTQCNASPPKGKRFKEKGLGLYQCGSFLWEGNVHNYYFNIALASNVQLNNSLRLEIWHHVLWRQPKQDEFYSEAEIGEWLNLALQTKEAPHPHSTVSLLVEQMGIGDS